MYRCSHNPKYLLLPTPHTGIRQELILYHPARSRNSSLEGEKLMFYRLTLCVGLSGGVLPLGRAEGHTQYRSGTRVCCHICSTAWGACCWHVWGAAGREAFPNSCCRAASTAQGATSGFFLVVEMPVSCVLQHDPDPAWGLRPSCCSSSWGRRVAVPGMKVGWQAARQLIWKTMSFYIICDPNKYLLQQECPTECYWFPRSVCNAKGMFIWTVNTKKGTFFHTRA